MINRRKFISVVTPMVWYGSIARKVNWFTSNAEKILTVTGEVPTASMGLTLTHEHLFSIFGMEPEEQTKYNFEELSARVLPFLEKAKAAGCKTIIDCTAAYFGRNVQVLKLLSEKSGLQILTNTGVYGAANGRYIPPYIRNETAEQISKKWISEFTDGIDGTGIRPGFMKLGFNTGSLAELDKKIIAAASQTHLSTGLTIAAHTSNNPVSAFQQLEILKTSKVSPSAWIWTHAHDVPENESLLEAAKTGAWISFDGYRAAKRDRFIDGLLAFKKAGFLHRVLLSHDGDGYPLKGKNSSSLILDLLTEFLPTISKNGFTAEDIHQLTVDNPAKAFALKIRRL